MPKKKNPDSPGGKLLKLYNKLLADGNTHSLTDLAKFLDCSPQTVLRLVSVIEEVNGGTLKVEDSRKHDRQNWYRLEPKKFRASVQGIGSEEVRYLAICRDLATGILPEEMLRKVDDALVSMYVKFGGDGSGAAEADHGCVTREFLFFAKGRIDYTAHTETIVRLLQARTDKSVCFVKYRPGGHAANDLTQHNFAPGRIVSLNNGLYVLGAGVDDENRFRRWTNLAIHRISLITVTEGKYDFEIPDASPETFGFPRHEPKTFRMRFRPGQAADFVRERVWAQEERKDDQKDGSLILTITTQSEPELMAWVRSFGDECELIG
ncbi:MAG: WYL domain-containing protein [Deltaproteobacteria bacterium]|jgi:hypothetical protein|nr:WYL domain-containing protein [Deltaproteobacteria bacterium]